MNAAAGVASISGCRQLKRFENGGLTCSFWSLLRGTGGGGGGRGEGQRLDAMTCQMGRERGEEIEGGGESLRVSF